MSSWSSRTCRNVVWAAGQVERSSRSSRTIRNVVPEDQDRSKCRVGAAGQVEMTSWSSRTGRNVVWEQQDPEAAWTGRNVVPEQQDRSKCRPGAAGQVEMSSGSRSKCRPGAAGPGNVVLEQHRDARLRETRPPHELHQKLKKNSKGTRTQIQKQITKNLKMNAFSVGTCDRRGGFGILASCIFWSSSCL